MAPLFRPGTDSVLRAFIALALGVPAVSLAGLLLLARNPLGRGSFTPREQPLLFDHRHHVGDEGIPCGYCHEGAWRSPVAGVPPTQRCLGCHAQVWNESARLEPVRASGFDGAPLPWNRVHALPDYVWFSHQIHVNKGVGCVTCHGRVDTMPAVQQVAPLTMGWCLDCHRDPTPWLRPVSEVANLTWRPPGDPRETGRAVQAALGVSPRTDCNTCHF
ncbi:cytochrome C [Corallococcus exiguus]|uniref:cytochrome c3 family protein n=1 Tax=Corallococcus TaxID=83461 RepID=UPI000EA08A86|nr:MULTISPECIES: cytochrome c3 family protein [Corallococcus]NRD60870.1 cytochrome C [Corallococcus exiguus]RKH26408.1 cytochrome C [Corallococcus sp. CA041A]RKI11732.1 cytochrome C [Corallococcus sp. AB030]